MNRTSQAFVYSAAGLAALAVLLVAFNFLAATAPLRVDLTDGKLYTLSDGTRRILNKLDAPVKVRLYISQGDNTMPVQLRSFAQRVEDMVREFRSVAGANLVIEKYNPKPDSDEEDAAQLDGIEPQQLMSGETFYLGLSVSQLDRKQAIAAVSPQRERLLEYDLIRAVARVANPEKPVLGLMSGVAVLGEQFNPFTRQGSEPWALANELKRDFNVKAVNMSAAAIDPEIKVLLLIHPRDISDKAEYALDQFVMRGGKLIAFVDPFMYFDQQPNPMMPQQMQQGTSSTLPTLFKAWGLEMDPGKVIADITYASGGGPRYTPTVLSLNRTAINREDVTTSQIESLLYAFGGAFAVKPVDGLKITELIRSSATTMLVDNIVASVSGDAATKGFVPSGKSSPLALRLTGRFKTAFPDGLKADEPAKPAAGDAKPAAAKPPAAPQLKESAAENSVILVADADMLADGAAVDIQTVFGQRVVVPSNGNLNLVQNMVEQMFAGDDLIGLRSRASGFRPLTVIREMEAKAQQQYFGKIQALEKELQTASEKIQALQKGRADAKSAQILSPEQQAELEAFRKRVIETRRELKELRKQLRQDAESLQNWTKSVNIALVPVLVALFGVGFAAARRKRASAAAGQRAAP